MKKLVIVIIFMLPLILAAQTCVPAGPVSGTWPLEGSPYFIYGDIYITEDDHLIIEAGVEVFFTAWYEFMVNGKLNVMGTKEQKVWFTTANPHMYWKGISFIETNKGSSLDHCIIEHASSLNTKDAFPGINGGGLTFLNSPDARILVSNCLIRDNESYFGGGIQVVGSNPHFNNCEIVNNMAVSGGGVSIMNDANVVLYESLIAYNRAEYGGGVNIYQARPNLTDNTIKYNDATEIGGGIRVVLTTQARIKGNVIAFNSALMGGGLCINHSEGSYCSNTISYNEATLKGGGLYVYGPSKADILNSVLYFNKSHLIIDGEQVYLQSDNSNPDFRYCNIDGGFIGFAGPGLLHYNGKYEYNIDGDPLFLDGPAGNFEIGWDNYPVDDQSKSACIDAGCPALGGDPDCSCCDIGASYFFQLLEVPVAKDPFIHQSQTSFIAVWSKAYGSLGYLLDVSKDPEFNKCILKNRPVADSSYLVEVPGNGQYFYRVRAYNTGLKSAYSNTMIVDISTFIDENIASGYNVYTSYGDIIIDIDRNLKHAGNLRVYNLSGQLLAEQELNRGHNRIGIDASRQLMILRLLLDGKAYQQKILLR